MTEEKKTETSKKESSLLTVFSNIIALIIVKKFDIFITNKINYAVIKFGNLNLFSEH